MPSLSPIQKNQASRTVTTLAQRQHATLTAHLSCPAPVSTTMHTLSLQAPPTSLAEEPSPDNQARARYKAQLLQARPEIHLVKRLPRKILYEACRLHPALPVQRGHDLEQRRLDREALHHVPLARLQPQPSLRVRGCRLRRDLACWDLRGGVGG